MYSPCDENSYEKTAYNDYSLIRDLPTIIINYLFENSPDFWKLLKYSQNPLSKPDLTNEEKSKMIGKSSFNTEKYNVLFQKYTTDAVVKAITQVRVFVDNVSSYGRTNALARIIFQVVVNNNEMIINTPMSKNDKRDVAIMQTIVQALNGVKVDKTKSQMFINNQIDRFAGAQQVSYNNDYSGFQLTMDVWI